MTRSSPIVVTVVLLLVTAGFAPVAGAAHAPASASGPPSDSVVTSASALANNTTDATGGNETEPSDRKPASANAKISTTLTQNPGRYAVSQPASAVSTDSKTGTVVRVVVEAAPGKTQVVKGLVGQAGGSVETDHGRLVQAQLPESALTGLAKSSAVEYVRQPIYPEFSEVTSEGLSNVNADDLHGSNVTGENVTVAVIDSTGFNLSNPEIADQVVGHKNFSSEPFGNGTSDLHGTAVAEVVADTAPNASLLVYKPGTYVEFMNAVDHIDRNTPADVVVVSMSWYGIGPLDGTSYMNQEINDLTDNGTLWVNSAGNSANRHWNGTWSDPDGNRWMNFSGNDELMRLDLSSGASANVWMQWDDWDAVNEDYDVYVYKNKSDFRNDPFNAWYTGSGNAQNGSSGQEPTEVFGTSSAPGSLYVAIYNYDANGTEEFTMWFRGNSNPEYQTRHQSVTNPGTGERILTVGAAYHGTNGIESFSSRGPTIDGRQKPDLVAPDGVSTSSSGTFYGTSAAAPHAAGVAALVLDAANQSLSPGQLKSALVSNARDVNGTEPDYAYGHGMVDAKAAVDGLDPYNVTTCVEINSPGRYELQANITSNVDSACIDIESSNVTLDGNGYTVDRMDSSWLEFRIGVQAYGSYDDPFTNVTVTNLTVTNAAYGVAYDNVTASSLDNVTVENGRVGFYTWNATNTTFRDVGTVDANYGFWTYRRTDGVTIADADFSGSNVTGLYVSRSANVTVDAATVTDAGEAGIYVENATGTTLTGVNVSGSASESVHVRDSSATTVSNSVLSGSAGDGVYADGSNGVVVTDTTVENATDWALNATNGSTVSATNYTLTGGASVNFTAHDAALGANASPPAWGADLAHVGPFVDATSTSSGGWLSLNVSYAESETTDLNESVLRLYRHDGSDWVTASGTTGVNATRNVVYGNVTSFGTVGAFALDAPNAALDRDAVDVGDVTVGNSSASSVNVTNDGTEPLNVTSLSVVGENETAFSASLRTDHVVVDPGNATEIGFEFAPGSRGVKNATLRIAHNASGSPSSVSLSGRGVEPVANVTVDATPGGQFNVSGETDEIPVTVRNDGNAPLNVTSTTLAGDDASQYAITSGGSTPVVFGPGQSREVVVTFDPTSPGTKSVVLSVAHNDTDASPSNVSIARDAVDATPPVLDGAAAVDATDGSRLVNRTDSVEVTVNVTDNVAGHVDSVTANASVLGAGPVELTNLTGNATYRATVAVDAPNATDGDHRLPITATDSSGNVNATSTSAITVDVTNATLNVAEPANGTAVNRSWVWVNGTASDVTSGVAAVAIDTPAGSQTTTPTDGTWSFNVSGLSDGTHTFAVNATDDAGNVNETTVTVTVDTRAPNFTAQPTLDRTDEILPEAGLRLAVNVSDGLSGVADVTASDVTLRNATSPPTWNATANVTASPRLGNRTMTVTVRDAAGNAETATVDYSVGVTANMTNESGTFVAHPNDTNLQNVSIVAPNATGNQSVTVGTSRSNPTRGADPSDVGLAFPQVNTTIPNAVIENGTLNVTVPASRVEAEYALRDTVTFHVHNETTNTWNATNGTLVRENDTHLTYEVETPHFSTYALAAKQETTPPTVSGLSPADGETVESQALTLRADYSDDYSGVNASTVRLLVDGSDVTGDANTTVGATGVEYPATFDEGQHTVKLSVADEAGNVEWRNWTFTVSTGSSGGSTGSGGGGGGGGAPPVVSRALASKAASGATVEVINGQPSATARTVLPDGVSAGGVTYTGLEVAFAASAGDFALTIEPRADRPGSVPAPSSATPVAYYTVEGGVSEAAVDTARLSFEVSPGALPADADPDHVAVLRYHDGAWQVLDTTRNGYAYTARSPGFSAFAVVVTQPDVVVTDAALDADSVAVGEAASATVTVENQGTREGTRTVELTAGGEVVASQDVTVAPGESTDVTLAWTPGEAGTYDVTAGGESAGTLSVAQDGDATTTTPGGSDGPSDDDTSGGVGFTAILGGLAVLLVLAGALYARREGLLGGEDAPDGGE